MIPADQHAEGVLSLPTPLARLYGVALQMGMRVTDGNPELWDPADEENFSDAAAIVGSQGVICLNPSMDDDLRSDVLAMALSVAAMMICDESVALPGDVVAPGGFVVITPYRIAEPPDGRPVRDDDGATMWPRHRLSGLRLLPADLHR